MKISKKAFKQYGLLSQETIELSVGRSWYDKDLVRSVPVIKLVTPSYYAISCKKFYAVVEKESWDAMVAPGTIGFKAGVAVVPHKYKARFLDKHPLNKK